MRLQTLVFVTLAAAASAARAQTTLGDANAFIALRSTHIGSLTPMLTPAMISRRLNGAQLGIRYGLRTEGNVRTNSIAASGIFGVGLQSSVTLTGGVVDADCTNCSPELMLGLGGDMRIAELGDVVSNGSILTIAVSGDVGYAQLRPENASAIALGVGAPVTLSFGGRDGVSGMRFAPYFTPMFGIGQTTLPCGLASCEKSGTRWVLGGGVGVWNPQSTISASLGINHVMLSGAKPVFGVNVAIGGI